MIALYRCLKCLGEWRGKPGAVKCPDPRCGHLYVKWLNYDGHKGGEQAA